MAVVKRHLIQYAAHRTAEVSLHISGKRGRGLPESRVPPSFTPLGARHTIMCAANSRIERDDAG